MADKKPAVRNRRREPWPPLKPGFGAWWREHGRIAGDTLHFVSSRLGTSLLVWLLVGIALALPAGLLLLQVNLAGMTAAWDGRPGLTVYFSLDASPPQVEAVAGLLIAESGVTSVAITTPEEALEEFRSFAGMADALETLAGNPLPASVSAILAPAQSLVAVDGLVALASARPGVDEVIVEKTWLERINEISRVVSRLGVILGALFGLGAVLVTATSVRLAIEARLEELRVQNLVGATQRQIRRPFLYFGAFYGIGGGLLAAMLISLCLVVLESPLTSLLGSYGQDFQMAGFDPLFFAALLAVGGALGIAGALVASKQRLRDLEIT